MSVRVHVSDRTKVTSISPDGPLTAGSATQQLSELSQSLLEHGTSTLLINMAGVTCIDSYGLGFLVSLQAKAENRSARMVLLNPVEEAIRSLSVGAWISPFEVVRGKHAASVA